jgi:cold shock CspA family protein
MRLEARVKWFHKTRCFGFLRTADGKEVYVHIKEARASGIEELHQHDIVSFEIGQSNNGKPPRAIKLKLLHAATET